MTANLQDISEISDEMMSDIAAPSGWDIVDVLKQSNADIEPRALAKFRKTIDINLSFVTKKVEELIYMLHEKLNIDIFESFLIIDADAAFHIFFLVDKEVYQSPNLVAARIISTQYLNSTDTVGMRYTFTISQEYLKYYVNTNNYKLKRQHVSYITKVDNYLILP